MSQMPVQPVAQQTITVSAANGVPVVQAFPVQAAAPVQAVPVQAIPVDAYPSFGSAQAAAVPQTVAATIPSAASAAPLAATQTAASVVVAAAAQTAAKADQVPIVVAATDSSTSWWWSIVRMNFPQTAALIEGITFAIIVKVLCMAGNVLVQVAPYPQAKRWEIRDCTGEVDPAPYVSIAFSGFQWSFYGTFAWMFTKRSGFLILVHSNCLGALLGTYYTITFYRHCRNAAGLNSFYRYLSAVTSLVVFQMCALVILPPERALFLTGLISSFCSFVGAMSMLVSVPVVLRTRDSRSISGPVVVAYLLSSIVWCICGWMLQDVLVSGPNVVAALSSSVCIYLKMKFPSLEECSEKEEELLSADIAELAMDGMMPLKPVVQKLVLGKMASEFTPLTASMPLKTFKAAAAKMVEEPMLFKNAELYEVPVQSARENEDGYGGTGGTF